MKKVTVIGKTDSVISLNKIGVPIHGRVRAILTITTPEQEAELAGVVRAGLIEMVLDPQITHKIDEPSKNPPSTPPITPIKDNKVEVKKGGRPKGVKNKPKAITKVANNEDKRVAAAEAKTQKMGSRVVIGTGNGNKEGVMKYSAIDEEPETERNKASIDAMKQLEAEEKQLEAEEKQIKIKKNIVDESKLPPSEQQGRKAVISREGQEISVNLTNNIIPGSKEIKEADPFIENKEDGVSDILIENDGDDGDLSDAFIKI